MTTVRIDKYTNQLNQVKALGRRGQTRRDENRMLLMNDDFTSVGKEGGPSGSYIARKLFFVGELSGRERTYLRKDSRNTELRTRTASTVKYQSGISLKMMI